MSLAEVYRALWRHKLVLVAGTVLVGIAAWYGIERLPPTYQASTLVRVQETAKNPGEAVSSLQAGQTLAETYATIVSSGALDARVAHLADADPKISGPVAVHVSASIVQGLDLFWVHASSRRARIAAAIANATPIALSESIAGGARTAGFGTLQVVKSAAVPKSPAAPHKTVDLVLAIAVGLAFNAALILLAQLAGDRLPPLAELERTFGTPVLGTVPRIALVTLPGAEPRDEPAVPAAATASNGGGGSG